MTQKTPDLLRVIVAGALVLLVVHTLGRFIYTPLLPWLVKDGLLSLKHGADVAGGNYLGAFIRGLLALRWPRVGQIPEAVACTLAINLVCTLLPNQVATSDGLSAFARMN